MEILSILLQYGALIIIPVVTLGYGIWRILKFEQKYHYASISGLIGFIFFEFSFIGMLIDPRSKEVSFSEIILTATGIGIATFLFVLVMTSVAILIWRIFK